MSDLKCKLIINHLNSSTNSSKLKVESKWENSLKLNTIINWTAVWSIIKYSLASNKAKQLQWKFLHNVIFTEVRLQFMGKSNGICNMCKSDNETLVHLFFQCPEIHRINTTLKSILEYCIQLQIPQQNVSISESDLFLGLWRNKTLFQVENAILFEFKWGIWKIRNDYKPFACASNTNMHVFT